MAPKDKSGANPKATKRLVQKTGQESKGTTEKQKLQSGILTYLKKSPLQSCQDVLTHYKSLSRFDTEKTQLLEKVAKDRKCLFFNDFKAAKSAESQQSVDSMKGYATMWWPY